MEGKKQLISTAEAAAFIGIKVSYLHKLVMRSVIPYYNPDGKLCFFDKAGPEAWMRNVYTSRFSSHAIFCPRFFILATPSSSFMASPGRRP